MKRYCPHCDGGMPYVAPAQPAAQRAATEATLELDDFGRVVEHAPAPLAGHDSPAGAGTSAGAAGEPERLMRDGASGWQHGPETAARDGGRQIDGRSCDAPAPGPSATAPATAECGIAFQAGGFACGLPPHTGGDHVAYADDDSLREVFRWPSTDGGTFTPAPASTGASNEKLGPNSSLAPDEGKKASLGGDEAEALLRELGVEASGGRVHATRAALAAAEERMRTRLADALTARAEAIRTAGEPVSAFNELRAQARALSARGQGGESK